MPQDQKDRSYYTRGRFITSAGGPVERAVAPGSVITKSGFDATDLSHIRTKLEEAARKIEALRRGPKR